MGRILDFNIITFQDSMNYGALLQAYALQSFIEELGYTVGILGYNRPMDENVKYTFRGRVANILKKITHNKKIENSLSRRFSEFRKNYLSINYSSHAKVFITGSDQVWNIRNSFDPMFFLSFVDDSIYKMSYAASMLGCDVPDDKQGLVREYLSSLDMISVREESVKDCLKKLYDGQIDVNLDPTLLHEQSFYDQIAKKIDFLPNHYILAYILHIPKNGNRILRWLKKETGYPVVLLDSSGNVGLFIKNDILVRDAGPREFLYLFKHADCVVTTSFHGTCFSIIFEKEFYAIVNPSSPGRINDLLKKVKIDPIQESDSTFIRKDTVDWGRIKTILSKEKARSESLFRKAYMESQNKTKDSLKGTIAQMKDQCTGCAACVEICTSRAIEMELNKRGFYEPVINKDKCVHCGLCVLKCPINSKQVTWPKKSYYGWNKSHEVLLSSSSGGAFYSLARLTLQNKGLVFGAVYSDDWKDIIIDSSDNVDLKKMQKSKYSVSSMGDTYKNIKKGIAENRDILFVGTPCQCAGILSVFGNTNDRIIVCDFVCGGMPSLKFYREHLEYLKNKYGSEITSLDFRPKEWGWGRHRISVCFSNGKRYVKRNFADSYFTSFIDKTSVREICHKCPYYHFHRSDITIADFWGYKAAKVRKRRSGMSMIVCNTEKGERFFNEIKDFEKKELPLAYSQYTIREKIPNKNKLEKAERLFELSEKEGFEEAANELYDLSEVRHYLKRIFNKAKD